MDHMKVRILRDADLPTHLVKAGMVFEVDEKYAKDWIESGIAELFVEKEKAIERRPKETRANH